MQQTNHIEVASRRSVLFIHFFAWLTYRPKDQTGQEKWWWLVWPSRSNYMKSSLKLHHCATGHAKRRDKQVYLRLRSCCTHETISVRRCIRWLYEGFTDTKDKWIANNQTNLRRWSACEWACCSACSRVTGSSNSECFSPSARPARRQRTWAPFDHGS